MSLSVKPELVSIAELIPHAGSMVLLDEVLAFDPEAILCRAALNPADNHPLSRDGRLPATALAEYGAQAMAVHGGLLAEPGSPPRPGRLVALGRLELAVADLDQPAQLLVRATRLGGDEAGQLYDFDIEAEGRQLASGRATVMFADAGEGS